MIAIDTNLLVYAHRRDSEWHQEALHLLSELAGGRQLWAIPWPCVHEFLSVTTHPAIYQPPSPLPIAMDAIQAWLTCPSCRAIGEGAGYFPVLKDLALPARAHGPRIHDARIAAICRQNGVAELWSADRDLTRFEKIKVRNPLVRPRRG